jgi:hypothetical protein
MFHEIEIEKIPSLNDFIYTDIFTNKPNHHIKFTQQFNIHFDKIMETGLSIGLSYNEIIKNIYIIRNALILKKITNQSFCRLTLDKFYCATCKFKRKECKKILDEYEIILSEDIFIEDVMSFAKDASNNIFKSIYLNT